MGELLLNEDQIVTPLTAEELVQSLPRQRLRELLASLRGSRGRFYRTKQGEVIYETRDDGTTMPLREFARELKGLRPTNLHSLDINA